MRMNEDCRILQNSGSHSNEPSAQVWLLIFVHMRGSEEGRVGMVAGGLCVSVLAHG